MIVAFGDNLTAGLGLPEKDSFPAQLERALKARGQEVKVVDAGVSGDTAAAGLARLDWAMPDDASAVIVELGANDALQGLDPAATKVTLEKIITELKARGLPILLAGMEAPRNMGKDYVDQFRALYADLAKATTSSSIPSSSTAWHSTTNTRLATGFIPTLKGWRALSTASCRRSRNCSPRQSPSLDLTATWRPSWIRSSASSSPASLRSAARPQ